MLNEAIALAADICRKFEGLYLRPYLCPAGVPTIGYGSTFYENGKKVTLNDAPITKDYAEVLLQYELQLIAPGVLKLCPALTSAKRLAAILSFTYNLGLGRLRASTLRKKINLKDWIGAKEEILKWNKGGGKILKGLTLRRQVEAMLLL